MQCTVHTANWKLHTASKTKQQCFSGNNFAFNFIFCKVELIFKTIRQCRHENLYKSTSKTSLFFMRRNFFDVFQFALFLWIFRFFIQCETFLPPFIIDFPYIFLLLFSFRSRQKKTIQLCFCSRSVLITSSSGMSFALYTVLRGIQMKTSIKEKLWKLCRKVAVVDGISWVFLVQCYQVKYMSVWKKSDISICIADACLRL